MRTVATVYWDRYNGTHHTVVCDVEDNGEHTVLTSAIHSNGKKTLDDVVGFWTKAFGVANVRAYTITEYVQDMGRYSQV